MNLPMKLLGPRDFFAGQKCSPALRRSAPPTSENTPACHHRLFFAQTEFCDLLGGDALMMGHGQRAMGMMGGMGRGMMGEKGMMGRDGAGMGMMDDDGMDMAMMGGERGMKGQCGMGMMGREPSGMNMMGSQSGGEEDSSDDE
jgi:hypothetical protein